MTEARPQSRLPLGLTLAVLVALGILCTLGVWQLQRLEWKAGLLDQIETRASAEARPLAVLLADAAPGDDLGFYRVRATCPGLAQAPFVQLYALKDGQAGSRLISACPIEGAPYGSILVDRGFVADTVSARPEVSPSDTPVEVVGLLRAPEPANFVTPDNRPAENQWFSRDIAAMAATLGADDPAPVFLLTETPTNPEFPDLTPAPLPGEIANRHLEYALTWFGLAGALIAVYAAMLWRRWKS